MGRWYAELSWSLLTLRSGQAGRSRPPRPLGRAARPGP